MSAGRAKSQKNEDVKKIRADDDDNNNSIASSYFMCVVFWPNKRMKEIANAK